MKLATESELEAIRARAEKTIEDATQFSINSPNPDPKYLAKDVYVEESYSADVIAKDKENGQKALAATDAYEAALKSIEGKTKRKSPTRPRPRLRPNTG